MISLLTHILSFSFQKQKKTTFFSPFLAAHYTAFFQDMDPREQNCLVNGQNVGAPLPGFFFSPFFFCILLVVLLFLFFSLLFFSLTYTHTHTHTRAHTHTHTHTDALWRTNHPYDPALMDDYLWWGTGFVFLFLFLFFVFIFIFTFMIKKYLYLLSFPS